MLSAVPTSESAAQTDEKLFVLADRAVGRENAADGDPERDFWVEISRIVTDLLKFFCLLLVCLRRRSPSLL
jgi:hypothetical protein